MTEAQRLRAEFDRSFAEPPTAHAEAFDTYLLVQAGKVAVALPTAGIRCIEQGAQVVPLPSALPSLLGVIGHRGRVVPVFSLAAQLGQPKAETGPQAATAILVLVELLTAGAATESAALEVDRVLHFVRQARDEHNRAPAAVQYLDQSFEVVTLASLFPGAEHGSAPSLSHERNGVL